MLLWKVMGTMMSVRIQNNCAHQRNCKIPVCDILRCKNFMTVEDRIEKQRQLTNEIHIEDTHYYQIALNLTGDREKFESEALELIKKFGVLRALVHSRNNPISKGVQDDN